VQISRRTALTFAAGAVAAGGASASKQAIRLGGPIFLKSDDPEALAKEHRRLGYSAAYCPAVKLEDKDRIQAITKAFAAENVAIAEVGAWKNMMDPNEAERKKNLDYVTERMALAEAVGARCCVDIAGSYNAKVWYGFHPQNMSKEFFDGTVQNCRHIIDSVKPKRTRFTIEMQVGLQPENPERYIALIKAVDRPQFGVHLDICNTINSQDRFYNNSAWIREVFGKLGKWVVSCHAKDLEWMHDGYNIHLAEVAPGKGGVDYGAYLTELSKLSWDAPLMLEHLKTAEDYDGAREHILKVGGSLGLKFA
jgi:sugar phosphate isomerase/epimerase